LDFASAESFVQELSRLLPEESDLVEPSEEQTYDESRRKQGAMHLEERVECVWEWLKDVTPRPKDVSKKDWG
jgi:hypothetical protein